jgi:hypothetical protein
MVLPTKERAAMGNVCRIGVMCLALAACSCASNGSPNSDQYSGIYEGHKQPPLNTEKKYRDLIGKRLWVPYYLADICDTAKLGSGCSHRRHVDGKRFYGPFVVEDAVYSDELFPEPFLVIRTPEGDRKYLHSDVLIVRTLVSEDPNAKAAKAKATCERKGGVVVGMTKEQVLSTCWGKPEKKNISTYAEFTTEQWVYNGGYLYFRNDILTSIQTSN